MLIFYWVVYCLRFGVKLTALFIKAIEAIISPLQKGVFIQKQQMLYVFPLSWFDSFSPHLVSTHFFPPKVLFVLFFVFVFFNRFLVALFIQFCLLLFSLNNLTQSWEIKPVSLWLYPRSQGTLFLLSNQICSLQVTNDEVLASCESWHCQTFWIFIYFHHWQKCLIPPYIHKELLVHWGRDVKTIKISKRPTSFPQWAGHICHPNGYTVIFQREHLSRVTIFKC